MQLTTTSNDNLPLRVGVFDTLAEGLDYAARGATGCNFFSERGRPAHSLTYREIRERALDLGLRFSASGLERGARVALIAETRPEFLITFFACQYAGLIPVPLPLSVNLGGREAYVARLAAMMQRGHASVAVTSEEMLPMLEEAARMAGIERVGSYSDFAALPYQGGEIRPLNKDEPAYIQFSSGSTSLPRGVMVTQHSIMANARGIGQHGLQLRAGDRATSWLPLYHDMGLVGFCLTPAMAQVSVDYLATTTFARRPLLWLQTLSDQGGTIAFAPTFGYELCLRRAAKVEPGQYDLSRWRVAGIGGEMIRASVLQAFADRFADCGFDGKAFLPSYGLAESTLAISFSALGEGVKVDEVDQEAAARRDLALPASAKRAKTFVRCGRPMPEHRIEIRDARGKPLSDRHIGRVFVSGPSLMEGYFRDPEATATAMPEEGWLDTGDLGYLAEGELVITGRSKDLIIVGGRNIWPQDLEWAVEKIEHVRAGDVAAFAVPDQDDSEQVVLVVECRLSDPAARAALRREISAVVQRSAGVSCEVVLTRPNALTFTSSGKLSRAAAKADYLAGRISDLDGTLEEGVYAMAVGAE
ncbi:MAG TPA: fatty acyl-AMP ligase [Kiloniellales bacterium]|nr:fatty acyl-AMP ligase [Kiloniellales bacterium]